MHFKPQTWVAAAGFAALSTSVRAESTNPLIPSSLSATCAAFLKNLNGDETFTSCTQPLISTISQFTPSGSNSYPSSDAVSSALDSFCAADPCSESYIRSTLSYFAGNCSGELNNENSVVLGLYDVLYTLTPLTAAVCSTDSAGGYCLSDIISGEFPASSNASSTVSSVSTAASTSAAASASASTSANISVDDESLVRRLASFNIQSYTTELLSGPSSLYYSVSTSLRRLVRRGSLTGILPNATTWANDYVPFLLLNPEFDSSILCTDCTKTVLSQYVAWEASIPYAIGLSSSPLLGKQGSLWDALSATCGSGFTSAISTKAGQSDLSGAVSSAGLSTPVLFLSLLFSAFYLM